MLCPSYLRGVAMQKEFFQETSEGHHFFLSLTPLHMFQEFPNGHLPLSLGHGDILEYHLSLDLE